MADSTTTYEAPSRRLVKKSGVSVVQSATLATYGAPVLVLPASGESTLPLPRYFACITASIGSETITFSIVANYSDGTSSTAVTVAPTTSTTTVVGIADNANAKTLAKDGVEIVSYSVSVKSSINTSTCVCTFDFVA